jgi:hypothetical protein
MARIRPCATLPSSIERCLLVYLHRGHLAVQMNARHDVCASRQPTPKPACRGQERPAGAPGGWPRQPDPVVDFRLQRRLGGARSGHPQQRRSGGGARNFRAGGQRGLCQPDRQCPAHGRKAERRAGGRGHRGAPVQCQRLPASPTQERAPAVPGGQYARRWRSAG